MIFSDTTMLPLIIAIACFHFGSRIIRQQWEHPAANAFRNWLAFLLLAGGAVAMIGGLARLFGE